MSWWHLERLILYVNMTPPWLDRYMNDHARRNSLYGQGSEYIIYRIHVCNDLFWENMAAFHHKQQDSYNTSSTPIHKHKYWDVDKVPKLKLCRLELTNTAFICIWPDTTIPHVYNCIYLIAPVYWCNGKDRLDWCVINS